MILIGIVGVIAFVMLCTLLPFFPGSYDPLAVPLSLMAQIFGTLGLVLIPFGLVWIAADRSSRFANWRHIFSWLALIVSSLLWTVMGLVVMLHSSLAFGIVILVFEAYVTRKVWPGLKRIPSARPSTLPFYLVIVPLAVALLQFALLGRAVEFSRNRAIQNSAPLIAAIEQYRNANGRYPTSLLAVVKDYKPGVIGIREFHYEPHADSYNLFFEQFTYQFGTQEFVMYNPRDEHVMTVHAADLLEMTPAQLALDRTRGHYALNNAPHPHWKYFWFD